MKTPVSNYTNLKLTDGVKLRGSVACYSVSSLSACDVEPVWE
uniref:Uncharacterized protein n=1 Tax=Anguilla anguilla TaxID=7936 RepID=A0A0E9RQI8_ANGAN